MEHIRIFVLLDGVGWQHLQHVEFLRDLCVHRVPLKTVLGYSSAAVPTILSGKLPSETGQWSMWYLSPETSPFRSAARTVRFPKILKRVLGITRQRIVSGFKERDGITGYCEVYRIPEELLPLLDTTARKNLYHAGALETCDSVFDVWTRAGVPFRAFGYPLRDHQSLRETADDVRCNPKPLYFLHLYETDAFLHTRCRDLEGFAKALRPYAAGLEEIYRAACQTARTVELSIFSDHGMTPVVGEVDLMGRVEGLGLRMFRDFIALYDSTMARFWFRHPGAEARILGALEGVEKVRLLPEAELRRLGVFFPDRRFGQVIFLVEPGWVINPSHMGSVALAGMHGYHPDEDPWADAMLLSTRAISAETRHIADLFDWMRPGDHGDRAP